MAESNILTLAEPRRAIHLGAVDAPAPHPLCFGVEGAGTLHFTGSVSDPAVAAFTWFNESARSLAIERLGVGSATVTLTPVEGGPVIEFDVTVPDETGTPPTEAHLGEPF